MTDYNIAGDESTGTTEVQSVDYDRYTRSLREAMDVEPVGPGVYDVHHDDRCYRVELERVYCGCKDHKHRNSRCKHLIRAAVFAAFTSGVRTEFVADVLRAAKEFGCPDGGHSIHGCECEGPLGDVYPCPECVAGTSAGDWTVWTTLITRGGESESDTDRDVEADPEPAIATDGGVVDTTVEDFADGDTGASKPARLYNDDGSYRDHSPSCITCDAELSQLGGRGGTIPIKSASFACFESIDHHGSEAHVLVTGDSMDASDRRSRRRKAPSEGWWECERDEDGNPIENEDGDIIEKYHHRFASPQSPAEIGYLITDRFPAGEYIAVRTDSHETTVWMADDADVEDAERLAEHWHVDGEPWHAYGVEVRGDAGEDLRVVVWGGTGRPAARERAEDE